MTASDFFLLFFSILSPALVTAGLIALALLTPFGKISLKKRQITGGLALGLLAVFFYLMKLSVDNVWVLMAEGILLIAGVVFGELGSVVCGLFCTAGYFLSWFVNTDTAAAWAYYNRLPDALMIPVTVVMGILMFRWLFKSFDLKWYTGVVLGLMLVTIHIFLEIICNYKSAWLLFYNLTEVEIWRMLYNGLAVVAAGIVTTIFSFSKKRLTGQKGPGKLSVYFFRFLAIAASIAFFLSMLFSWNMEEGVSMSNLEDRFNFTLQDVSDELDERVDKIMLDQVKDVASYFDNFGSTIPETILKNALSLYEVTEVNVIDKNGIISQSTNPDFVGFDMHSGEQSRAFLTILSDPEVNSYCQEFGTIAADSTVSMKYAAYKLFNGGFVQIGYDETSYHDCVDEQIQGLTRHRRIGSTGAILIVDADNRVISSLSGYTENYTLDDLGFTFDKDKVEEETLFKLQIEDGSKIYAYYCEKEGFSIICYMTRDEARYSIFVNFYMMLMTLMLISFILILIVYELLKRHVVKDINEVRYSLDKIARGDLEVRLDVRSSEEFDALSDDINTTVDTLKGYIDEVKTRMERDLETAKQIQFSSLPQPMPARPDLAIHARMRTAKEVGGDLYDYVMLDDRHLMFLIGDVSGKGIPAALFMMTVKTKIRDTVKEDISLEEAAEIINDGLCENNETNTFVTVWVGILDIETGHVHYVSAGHNPPLLGSPDKGFDYVNPPRRNVVFGAMEGLPFRGYDFDMKPGDKLLLYTDGVTEAEDIDHNQYGEDRLKAFMDREGGGKLEEIGERLYGDIDTFAGEADQFDDITMVILEYKGNGRTTPIRSLFRK